MPVGPLAVGGGPVGRGVVAADGLALGEPVGVDHVGGAQQLRVEVLLQVEHVEHALGVHDLLAQRGGLAGGGLGAVVAEQLGGLVEQRHVGGGPAQAGGASVGGQRPRPAARGRRRAGAGWPRRGAAGRRTGRRAAARPTASATARRARGSSSRLSFSSSRMSARSPASSSRAPAGHDRARDLLGQQPHGLLVEDPLGLVVRLAGAAGPGAGGVDDVAVERAPACCSTTSSHRPARQLLAVAHRRRDHAGHLRPALHLGDLRRLGPSRVQAREELPDGAEHDAGLAQRRQHLPDVAQERRVGPDHEHAAAGQPVAVGVEQVRGPVQRDGGLAGARAALHHQHARRLRPDDLVLLGLDRGDDVGHPPGAARAHRGQQRGLAGEPAGLGDARRTGGVEVEDLVVDGGDLAAAGAQVPAPAHALRRRGRGRVERAGPPAPASPSAAARTRSPRRAGRAGRRSGRSPSSVSRRPNASPCSAARSAASRSV